MRPTEDSYRHKGLRKKLIELIRTKGITDEKVLHAMEHIPRHFFLDSAFDEVAYEDKAFPIAEKQTHHEGLMDVNLSTFASAFWQPPRYC